MIKKNWIPHEEVRDDGFSEVWDNGFSEMRDVALSIITLAQLLFN
jgi:hypothetical protein